MTDEKNKNGHMFKNLENNEKLPDFVDKTQQEVSKF